MISDKEFEQLLSLDKNFDILKKEIKVASKKVTLFYVTSLIDPIQFDYMIRVLKKVKTSKELKNDVGIPSVSELNTIKDCLFYLYCGTVLLFYKGAKSVLCIDIRHYPSRSISEPDSEKAVRGSRDGFNETLITNIALLRRRIKDTNLCVEHFIISKESKISVALCYMKNVAQENVISALKKRLQEIEVNSLIMTDRALEECLFNQEKTILPLVRYTERPDVASIHILNGKAALLVDTSSSCILTPVTLIDHTRHVEEFRETPIVGSFTRFLRTLAIFVSVFLLPLWIVLWTDKEIYNGFINVTLSKDVNMPILAQVIIASSLIEVFRIASIHTPNSLASGISLVAAIILGQISMDLEIFLPEILLFVCIASICSFATPSYELSLANKLISLIFILLASFFGIEGFLIGIIILFTSLLSIKVFSVPYLYPICPFDPKKAINAFVREDAKDKKTL